jgi:alanyl-tRNA synthetase
MGRAAEIARRFGAYYGQRGSELQAPGGIIPFKDPSTLFVSAGIQPLRDWALGPDTGGARHSAQWCLRMNRLEAVGSSPYLTSFCMLSMVGKDPGDRRQVFADLFSMLVAVASLSPDDLAFVVPQAAPGRPTDASSLAALTDLGMPGHRVHLGRQKWAMPFRPDGPTGPNVYVFADMTARPCSAGCGPTCGCGRYRHIWNCEFLEYRRAIDGHLRPDPSPVLDSAGAVERLESAARTRGDVWGTSGLAPVVDALAAAVSRDIPPTSVRAAADHCRSVALLLGSGVVPGGRGHGHVLRRLIRRALTLLAAEDAPGPVAAAVRLAGTVNGPCADFPLLDEAADVEVLREAERLRVCVQAARRRYERIRPDLHRSPIAASEGLFSLTTAIGVPLGTMLRWLAEDGIAVHAEHIAELRARARHQAGGHAKHVER